MPHVTVVIPNFNHAPYLRRRIDSVLAQTYQDFELVLMDDCSTDNSRAILSEYAATEPRARLILNDVNSGSTFKQWNKGVRAAMGELIWLAESDDYADPGLLARLVRLMDENPNVGIAYCESNIVDEHDVVLGTTHDNFEGAGFENRWKKDFIANGPDECARVLSQQNMIPNASAAVFRRSLFDAVGGADESMRLCGDWKLWAAMLLRSDLAHVAQPLNFFRTHRKNVRTSTKSWVALLETLLVVKFICDAVTVHPDIVMQRKKEFADRWINAWLWANPAEKPLRAPVGRALRSFDKSFRWRVAGRMAHRLVNVAKSGKAGYWAAHVFAGKRK